MIFKQTQKHQDGFALLLSLIVLGVVVSVALTMIEITIKQLQLSTIAKDSELAFHASSAGVECLRYWRLASSTEFETQLGDTVDMDCLGAAPVRPTRTLRVPDGISPGTVDLYSAQFSWGSPARCSKIDFIVIASDPADGDATVYDVGNDLVGYPSPSNKSCPAGGKCTYVSAKGYNTTCNNVGLGIGVVEREVLLEL